MVNSIKSNGQSYPSSIRSLQNININEDDIEKLVNIASNPNTPRAVREKIISKLFIESDKFTAKEIKSIEIRRLKDNNEPCLKVTYKNGLSVIFGELSEAVSDNSVILEALRILPAEFFRGLDCIVIPKKPCSGAGKCKNGTIELGYVNLNVLIHELFHHWDINLTKGYPWKMDLSQIFYMISWVNAGDKDPNDFLGRFDIEEWNQKKFGQENQLEDLATFSIFATKPVELRKYLREQMEKGNFEPAAKYLFVRFIMPFKGREYEVGKESPSLGFGEVRSKLNAWLKGYPNSVRQTTIDAINIIEDKAKSLIK